MDATASLPLSMEKDPSELRGVWAHRAEFILASVGYAVGSGNVWRFPYICYRNGGGAFLIPFFIMLFLCAIPMVFLENVVGQYTQKGPMQAFAQICPIMKGVGIAPVVISYLTCTYTNTIVTWILFYVLHSFSNPLPWKSCNNTWNIPENCSISAHSNTTHLRSPSQQFFDHRLLDISEGINVVGNICWELAGLLVLAWAIEYLCIFKGIRFTGKVVYFTTLFPYAVLLVLLINNVRLPGATEGILFFLTPKWHKLGEIQVWIDAASQVLFSAGVGFGVMTSLASYNKFNNILRDSVIVCLANSATSVFAGFVIFSAMGYLAHIRDLPVDELAVGGPGLAFVVYPEILAIMPASQLWAFLFFLMLFFLALGSQFPHLQVVVTCAVDSLGPKLPSALRRKELLVALVCLPGLLLGLMFITQGGVYVFQLMDHYTASVSVMIMAFAEVAAIIWIFGIRRFSAVVQKVLGKPPNVYFKACLLVITPLVVIYGRSYRHPGWAQGLGWMFTLCSIGWIPLGALHELCRREGTLLQRLRATGVPELTIVSDPSHHQGECVPLSSI